MSTRGVKKIALQIQSVQRALYPLPTYAGYVYISPSSCCFRGPAGLVNSTYPRRIPTDNRQRSNLSPPDMHQQHRHIRRRDPADAAGLSDGARPDAREFFSGLLAEGYQWLIIKVFGQFYLF